jgi:hypothetical protein
MERNWKYYWWFLNGTKRSDFFIEFNIKAITNREAQDRLKVLVDDIWSGGMDKYYDENGYTNQRTQLVSVSDLV